MNNSVLFSENNYNTVVHANIFLSQYKNIFKWCSNETILDIGCANGRVAKEVLYPFVEPHLNQLIGGDNSQEAIDVANKAYKSANLTFEKLDITNIEVCKMYWNCFHHIFGFYIFHCLHKPDLWSENVYKMLKHEGQLFTSIIVDSETNPILNKIFADQRNDKSKPWSKYIENLPNLFYDFGPKPKETIKGILEKTGFVVDVMDIQPMNFYFSEFSFMRNTFIGANHFLKYIPEELKEMYIEELSETLQEITNYENGKYTYSINVLTVVATKA